MSIKQLGKLPKELTKKDIEDLAKADISEIIGNEKYDLLKTYIELKRYNVYIGKLIAELKVPVLEKVKTIDATNFSYENAKVLITRRVSYDYSRDVRWTQINEHITGVKLKLKEHQELLKHLSSETEEMIDENTGEVIEVTAPVKKEESGLMIRIG